MIEFVDNQNTELIQNNRPINKLWFFTPFNFTSLGQKKIQMLFGKKENSIPDSIRIGFETVSQIVGFYKLPITTEMLIEFGRHQSLQNEEIMIILSLADQKKITVPIYKEWCLEKIISMMIAKKVWWMKTRTRNWSMPLMV
jgi:hypothetical protein